MSFTENSYLNWYIPRLSPTSGAINLHSSGMPAVRSAELSPPQPTGFEMIGLAEAALAKTLNIPKNELVLTSGATGGTLLVLLGLANRDAEFVVETPIYEPMLRQAERLGRVKRLERTFHTGWQIDLERAEATIDDDTAVVLITEPHNPSGVFSTPESIDALAEICEKRNAYLLINEVYLGYSTRKSHHLLRDNVLIVNSYSKLLGAYANRVGWVSATAELVSRIRWASLNAGAGSAPSAAMAIAFTKEAAERTRMAREAAAKWVDTVDDWLKEHPALAWRRPEGPGFGAIPLPPGVDDLAFINRLYDTKNVLAIPGSLFFAPGTIRISWLGVGDRLQEGLARLAETLGEITP